MFPLIILTCRVLILTILFPPNPHHLLFMSTTIEPHVRVSYLLLRDALHKSFKDVFYKYVRPGVGYNLSWTLHFGKEQRDDVIHRLKLLLSWITDDDVSTFTENEILNRIINQYKSYDHDDFIMAKYGDIYLD